MLIHLLLLTPDTCSLLCSIPLQLLIFITSANGSHSMHEQIHLPALCFVVVVLQSAICLHTPFIPQEYLESLCHVTGTPVD